MFNLSPSTGRQTEYLNSTEIILLSWYRLRNLETWGGAGPARLSRMRHYPGRRFMHMCMTGTGDTACCQIAEALQGECSVVV